jgi:hypothetical protein
LLDSAHDLRLACRVYWASEADALAARLRAGPGLPVGPRKPTGQWQDAVLVPGPWLGPGFRAQLDPVGVDR